MLGYVKTEFGEVGRDCEVRVLDQRHPARIIAGSPYDPDNEALRA
jgi:dimethylglycine dehydrogenase